MHSLHQNVLVFASDDDDLFGVSNVPTHNLLHFVLSWSIDGPKWVCDPHRITKLARDRKKEDPNHPGCVIYSIGSNGDFKFEMGMQNTVGEGVCEFHIFDFGDFEGMIPPKLRRAYYHRWGLKKQEDPTTKIDSSKRVGRTKMTLHGLQDTIKLLGHENLDVIDIFVSQQSVGVFFLVLLILLTSVHPKMLCRKSIARIANGIHTWIGYRSTFLSSIKFRWKFTVLQHRRVPEVQSISLIKWRTPDI